MSVGGFVMVPEWFSAMLPSGNQMLVYIAMARHGTWNPATGEYDECRPAVETVAKKTGLSVPTVKRVRSQLVEMGVLKRRDRFDDSGAQLPSVYQVVFGAVVQEGGIAGDTGGVSELIPPGDQGRYGGGLTGDTEGVSPVSHNQEPIHQEPNTKRDSASPTDSRTGDEPPAPSTSKRTSRRRTKTADEPAETDGNPTPRQRAFGIARGWRDYRAKIGTPIVARKGTDPLLILAKLIEPALLSGYEDDEVKRALNGIGEGIPSASQLDRGLAAVRGRPRRSGRPEPASLRVNDAWGDVAADNTRQPSSGEAGAA